MALLKCPECNHKVSEHANFCPECGCTIEYIKQYYSKKKTIVKDKKEPQSKSAIENFSDDELQFLKQVNTELSKCGVAFVLAQTKDVVGFRKNKGSNFLMYLSKDSKNNTKIHFYNDVNNKCASRPFDLDKAKEYIRYIKYDLFKVDKAKEITQKYRTSKDELKEYKEKYCYAIYNNQVVRINIEYVSPKNNPTSICFSYPDGEKCIISMSEANRRLFNTKYMAKLQNDFEKSLVGNAEVAYVLKDSCNQYFKGMHTTKNYETYRTNYGREASGYTTSEVPDFTLDIKKATIFYDYDGAKKMVEKLKDVLGELEIVELKKY